MALETIQNVNKRADVGIRPYISRFIDNDK